VTAVPPSPGARRIVDLIVDAVERREDELVARMLERFATEAPESAVGVDPDMTEAMRRSSHANLRAAISGLRRGDAPLASGPPSDAIEEARTSARMGVSLVAGVQTYRIGQAVVWDAVLDALERIDGDRADRDEALRICTRHTFAYVDAVIPPVADAYARERDRLVRGREQRRVQLVRDLLDGADVDGGALGYDPAGRHRAVIAWGPGADDELGRIAAALRARPLVVAVNDQTSWGWLGGGAAHDDRAVRDIVGGWSGGIALGRATVGPDGFRQGHVEARSAHRIGVATGDPVTWFDDVALEAAMLSDEAAARAFVAAELAGLDDDRDGRKLRDTLSAYFASGFNASAAAAALGVNDRTVAHRLRAIEDRIGRPVRARQTELQAAIRLERVLGAGRAGGG